MERSNSIFKDKLKDHEERWLKLLTCTEQDKHITSVNDSYCYLCAQHSFLKSIVIVITTLFPINHYKQNKKQNQNLNCSTIGYLNR
jgi:hypothetical protein